MEVTVRFFSYFKDVCGNESSAIRIHDGATLQELTEAVLARFPGLQTMRRSMLVAVGVEYQAAEYVLKPSDEVSFFPPVQGG